MKRTLTRFLVVALVLGLFVIGGAASGVVSPSSAHASEQGGCGIG